MDVTLLRGSFTCFVHYPRWKTERDQTIQTIKMVNDGVTKQRYFFILKRDVTIVNIWHNLNADMILTGVAKFYQTLESRR